MPGMAPWSPVALPPRFVAARRTRLVGRRYELGVLETVWERVAQGAGQVLLVGGEPGAGKTRLAAEAAGVLHEQGAAVLVGTATKDAGVPYQPFVEMLDHLFLASEPGTLDRRRRNSACCPGTPTPPPGRRPSRSATAAATCSRPSPSCSGRWPGTGHWSSSSTTCTGRSCRPSRCSSTWSTPAWTPRRWWWAPSGPPRRTGRTSSAPGWPTCTGWTACAASTCAGSTPRPSPSSCASTRVSRRPRRGPPRRSCATGPAATRSSSGRPGSTSNGSGGVAALRGPQRVPATLGDTLAARLAGLGTACGRPSSWPR